MTTYKGYTIINEGTKYNKDYHIYTEQTNDGGRTFTPKKVAGGYGEYTTIEDCKRAINGHFGRL